MRLENFIAAKKLIFVRTIAIMDDLSPVRRVFALRCNAFIGDIDKGIRNDFDSPSFDILKMALCFNILEEVIRMVNGHVVYSKTQWKNIVWKKAWSIEDEDWTFRANFRKYTTVIDKTMGKVNYLVWWHISDHFPKLMRMCEVMSRIVCRNSMLKSDDYRSRRENVSERKCSLCDRYEHEDMKHMILHCPFHENRRNHMLNEIATISPNLFDLDPDILNIVLGKNVPGIDPEQMCRVWICAGKAISAMYYNILKSRTGIG